MASTTTKRHPIRGFLYGIVFGLGLALIAIGQKWAALGTWPPLLLLIIGIIVGTLWSTFGPAKAPKGAAPSDPGFEPEPEPEPDPGTGPDAADTPTAELDQELDTADQELDSAGPELDTASEID